MLPKACLAALVSWRQQAWSLTTQSTLPSSSFCHRNSTSSRGRIGGFTFASTPAEDLISRSKCPMVTSRRKSMCGNTSCICSAAHDELEVRVVVALFRPDHQELALAVRAPVQAVRAVEHEDLERRDAVFFHQI